MSKDDFLIRLFVGSVLMVATIQDLFSSRGGRRQKKTGSQRPFI